MRSEREPAAEILSGSEGSLKPYFAATKEWVMA
jgi:hypothetical protein